MKRAGRLAAIPLGVLWLIRGVLILVVLWFIFSSVVTCTGASTPPKVEDAPWVVQTQTRYFYGKTYELVNGFPTLKGYWALDNDRYNYHKGEIVFDRAVWGPVSIIRRQ